MGVGQGKKTEVGKSKATSDNRSDGAEFLQILTLASPATPDTFDALHPAEASRVQQEILDLFRAAEAEGKVRSDELFAALYAELHRLAEQQLRRGGGEVTLSATTLLHEAYLDIAGRDGVAFPDRARFMGYAARAMRGIVIDHVRHTGAQKRGGGVFEITLGTADLVGSLDAPIEFEQLSDALDELAEMEPALAELVDLHFFCGFGLAEIAALQDASERTVQRNWRKARLLLHHALSEELSS